MTDLARAALERHAARRSRSARSGTTAAAASSSAKRVADVPDLHGSSQFRLAYSGVVGGPPETERGQDVAVPGSARDVEASADGARAFAPGEKDARADRRRLSAAMPRPRHGTPRRQLRRESRSNAASTSGLPKPPGFTSPPECQISYGRKRFGPLIEVEKHRVEVMFSGASQIGRDGASSTVHLHSDRFKLTL